LILPFIVVVETGANLKSESAANLFGFLIVLVLFVLVITIQLRLLMLFPAIAVDAPAADWRNAMADTKGHTWRVLFVMLVTWLPILILARLLPYWFVHPIEPGSFLLRLAWAIFDAAAEVLAIAAFAVAASRLFYAFSARLGRPAGLRLA
jgi:hypothetical protein